jgi:hypothetical protein
MSDTSIKSGVFASAVTFESDRGAPVCVRGAIVESDPSEAARKAVFRALPQAVRVKWESVVIVLTRIAP